MNSPPTLESLLQQSDWVQAVCACDDTSTKREALFRCASVMLPFWEARFDRDDSMSGVVAAMAAVVETPTPANLASLEESIPQRERRHWDLSPPPGYDHDNHSNCPADFAGDSIFYAACAISSDSAHDDDDVSAFDTAIEAIARLLAERNQNDDDQTDYPRIAADDLRDRILRHAERTTA